MNTLAASAAALWNFQDAKLELAAQRENVVFRVTSGNNSRYALRLHRAGYNTDEELRSEIDWLAALKDAGLPVPRPLKSTANRWIERVGEQRVSVLSWLPGKPLGATGEQLTATHQCDVFQTLGETCATLHNFCDRWQPPDHFIRREWNAQGLLGNAPVWGPFWENPSLSTGEQQLFGQARREAFDHLSKIEDKLDYGLIHADLVGENILIDTAGINLIDFDDGGFGFRAFELATILRQVSQEPNRAELTAALLTGYQHARIPGRSSGAVKHLNLFRLLRALTYVGWIIPRIGDSNSNAWNRRLIDAAVCAARDFLDDQNLR